MNKLDLSELFAGLIALVVTIGVIAAILSGVSIDGLSYAFIAIIAFYYGSKILVSNNSAVESKIKEIIASMSDKSG